MAEYQKTNLKVMVGNTDGDVTVETSPDGKFRFKQLNTGYPNGVDYSEWIDPALVVTRRENATPDASTNQQDVIGWNGTSGSMDVIVNNLYQINARLFGYGALSPENYYLKHAHYNSGVNDTQISIAAGLAENMNLNMSREPEGRINAYVTSGVVDDIATTNTYDFVKGSKYVTVIVGTGTLAIGDALVVPAVNNETGIDVVVLVAKAKDLAVAGTVELTAPWPGESFTATDLVGILAASTNVGTAAAGIVLVGQDLDWTLGKYQKRSLMFRTDLVDFGATDLIEKSIVPMIGKGDPKRVADYEWFAVGNYGEHYRMGEPNLYEYRELLKANALGATYSYLSLDYYAKEGQQFVNTESPRQLSTFTNAYDSGILTTALNGLNIPIS